MESKHFLLAVCTLFLLSSFVQGQPGRHYVTCAHQQEKCVCKSSATECFDVEKLQTFTSYTLGTQGEIVTRGTLEIPTTGKGMSSLLQLTALLLMSLNMETARGYRFNPILLKNYPAAASQ